MFAVTELTPFTTIPGRHLAKAGHSLLHQVRDVHTFEQDNALMRTARDTEREREMFYLTTHSTHFIYGYMASDIWLRTILIVRKGEREKCFI